MCAPFWPFNVKKLQIIPQVIIHYNQKLITSFINLRPASETSPSRSTHLASQGLCAWARIKIWGLVLGGRVPVNFHCIGRSAKNSGEKRQKTLNRHSTDRVDYNQTSILLPEHHCLVGLESLLQAWMTGIEICTPSTLTMILLFLDTYTRVFKVKVKVAD